MNATTERLTAASWLGDAKDDTARIRFDVTTRPQKYGDGRTFHEFRIWMLIGTRPVGVEDGPSRQHATPADALAAGADRVAELKRCRLYAIRVTGKDIRHGEGRSCKSCAIAQALWRNQKRMGLDQWNFSFEVEPYGGIGADCRGVTLTKDAYDEVFTGLRYMPDLVSTWGGKPQIESMMEFAMRFDEWDDSRHMTIAEWREANEHDEEDARPSKPSPCSFVLNLSEMTNESPE